MKKLTQPNIYDRICNILKVARTNIARSVNSTQVCANWLIGREIVEEEQGGMKRADYGTQLIKKLSIKLQRDFGKGYSTQNLKYMRQFYLEYQELIDVSRIGHALRDQLPKLPNLNAMQIDHAVCGQSWKPGYLHSSLSWSHYRTMLRVEKKEARAFYEIEAINNNWTSRELERQINSLLFERLAKSKNKKGLMKLVHKGQKIQKPEDVFKDPLIIEFLGLPESHKLVESQLEQALITNLQDFLLELGKGFAFVSRQERITLEGDHFYVDLVFYHTVLKCYILVDLKTAKLTHADLGQMQLYVNYFDHERCIKGDNHTLGLILCTDKNDTVVKYMLASNKEKKIFASRYKLYLPSEKELKMEIKKDLKEIKRLKGQC
ncbi:MAG: PDDEXK nuclease domain-containing protein [Candidatus Uhrbacteria bacterium]